EQLRAILVERFGQVGVAETESRKDVAEPFQQPLVNALDDRGVVAAAVPGIEKVGYLFILGVTLAGRRDDDVRPPRIRAKNLHDFADAARVGHRRSAELADDRFALHWFLVKELPYRDASSRGRYGQGDGRAAAQAARRVRHRARQ